MKKVIILFNGVNNDRYFASGFSSQSGIGKSKCAKGVKV